MKFLLIASTLLIALTLLASCSSQHISDYKNNSPLFKPDSFFVGQLSAHGVIKNRSGQVTRYFNADIQAHWDKGVGTLEEKFLFNDGEVQYRTWVLTPNGDNSYSATAGDVIGEAAGKTAGNAFNLMYVLAVKYNGSTINLAVNDWMWLVDNNTIINESTLTKWGFKVGSIQLTIVKKAE